MNGDDLTFTRHFWQTIANLHALHTWPSEDQMRDNLQALDMWMQTWPDISGLTKYCQSHAQAELHRQGRRRQNLYNRHSDETRQA